MNWKLIFYLSPFAIVIGVASLFGLTGRAEPLIWLVVFVIYAFLIVKNTDGRYFLHGFLVSVLNGVIIAVIHAAFFSMYLANNPDQAEMHAKLPQSIDGRVFVLIFGPCFGALFGLVSGLFAFVAGKIMKKKSEAQNPARQNPGGPVG